LALLNPFHRLETLPSDSLMPKKPPQPKAKSSGRPDNPTIPALPMDEVVDAMFKISPKDVKRVLASKPGKKVK
jgi:hypothetical protein